MQSHLQFTLLTSAQGTWIQNTQNVNSDCVGIHYLLSGKTQWGIPLLHSYDDSVKNLHLRLPRCACYLNTLNHDRQ